MLFFFNLGWLNNQLATTDIRNKSNKTCSTFASISYPTEVTEQPVNMATWSPQTVSQQQLLSHTSLSSSQGQMSATERHTQSGLQEVLKYMLYMLKMGIQDEREQNKYVVISSVNVPFFRIRKLPQFVCLRGFTISCWCRQACGQRQRSGARTR